MIQRDVCLGTSVYICTRSLEPKVAYLKSKSDKIRAQRKKRWKERTRDQMKRFEKDHQTSQNKVGAYAVQCGECFKWRLFPSQAKYEEIRASFIEDPFVCSKKEGVSCDDPTDIEYNTSRLWIIDKPNIPKTPEGFKRLLTLRKDYSRLDAYYATPTGKKVRAPAEVEKFLEAYPKYKRDGVTVSSFSFATPKIMEDMIPRNAAAGDSSSVSKKSKGSTTNGN